MNASATGASPKVKMSQMPDLHNPATMACDLSTASMAKRKWNPPMLGPLPPTFLRILRLPLNEVIQQIFVDFLFVFRSLIVSSSLLVNFRRQSRSDFDIPDEQFAIMLQNEEFMNELRWNQEFMLALEKEQQEKGKNVDDLVFKERLKHMGKRSRKKFMQLAKVFTWQRNKKPGAVRHPDSLLLQEEHSDDDEPKRLPRK